MKIKITRTSKWDFDLQCPPHPSAFISKLPKFSTCVQYCKTFEDFDNKLSSREGTWLSKGKNHRLGLGCIIREEPQTGDGWYIKLGSLKALEGFIQENGECILSYENGEMTLEIYDTYRE